MRFTDGKINSFTELMDEIFYDWGFTRGPQLRRDISGIWVNKTGVFEDDGMIILAYKTSNLEVLAQDYKKLNDFYEMYENDQEFMGIIDLIADRWHKNNLKETKGSFEIEDLSIYSKNYKFYAKDKYQQEYEISKLTYNKLVKFYKLL